MNHLKLPLDHLAMIQGFCSGLDASAIPYFLARGGDKLPDQLTGSDLDVFVRSVDLHIAERILLANAKANQLLLIHAHTRSYFSAFWVAAENNTESGVLHIDLYPGVFTWKGLTYLSDGQALTNLVFRNSFRYPSPAVDALSLLLTSPLWGGFLKTNYIPRIRDLLARPEALSEVKGVLATQFGNDGTFVRTLQTRKPTGNECQVFSSELRRGVIKKSFVRNPLSAVLGILSFLRGEAKAWLRPPGFCLTILGPDGSGKSLLLDNLEPELRSLFGTIQKFHWRPSILPDIGVLFKRRRATRGEPVSNPHGKPPRGFFSSLLRIGYYLVDYWAGWLFKVWPAKARNQLVIFDRYAYDMSTDPKRFRFGLPCFLLEAITKLAPKPDLTIVLTASADVLLARKQEVSRKELENTLTKLKALAGEPTGSVHEIDCSNSPEEVCATVKALVLSTLQARLEQTDWS